MEIDTLDINTLREYIKVHIISLKQDWERLDSYNDLTLYQEMRDITSQIQALEHILGVINERQIPFHS